MTNFDSAKAAAMQLRYLSGAQSGTLNQPKTNAQAINQTTPALKNDTLELSNKYAADDGRISAQDKLKNFAKGVISPVTAMFSSPKNFLLGAGTIAAGGLLIAATGGAAAPVMVALGVAGGGIQLLKSAYKASNARTDNEARAAWQGLGMGTTVIAGSVAGSKAALKGAGVDTTNLNVFTATAKCFTTLPKQVSSSFSAFTSGKALSNIKNTLHIKKKDKPRATEDKPPKAEDTAPKQEPTPDKTPEPKADKPVEPAEPEAKPAPETDMAPKQPEKPTEPAPKPKAEKPAEKPAEPVKKPKGQQAETPKAKPAPEADTIQEPAKKPAEPAPEAGGTKPAEGTKTKPAEKPAETKIEKPAEPALAPEIKEAKVPHTDKTTQIPEHHDVSGMNSHIRNAAKNGTVDEYAVRLDAQFEKLPPLEDDFVFWRGRGEHFIKRFNADFEVVKQASCGDIIVPDEAYSYGAFHKKLAQTWASSFEGDTMMYEIHVPKGAKISRNLEHGGEVIFPRGAKYKLISKQRNEQGVLDVVLEYILPDDTTIKPVASVPAADNSSAGVTVKYSLKNIGQALDDIKAKYASTPEAKIGQKVDMLKQRVSTGEADDIMRSMDNLITSREVFVDEGLSPAPIDDLAACLKNLLHNEYGIDPIDAVGKKFNPSFMTVEEVIKTSDRSLIETVASIICNGFRKGEEIIKAVQVAVYGE